MKRVFRDRLSAVLIIVVFAVTAFLVACAGSMLSQLYTTQLRMEDPDKFMSCIYIHIQMDSRDEEAFCGAFCDAIGQIQNSRSTVGFSNEIGSYVFFCGGEIPGSLMSGKLLLGEDLKTQSEGFVYINKGLLNQCREQNGVEYFETEGRWFPVRGVLYNSYVLRRKVFRYIDPTNPTEQGFVRSLYEFCRTFGELPLFVGGNDAGLVERDAAYVARVFQSEEFTVSIGTDNDIRIRRDGFVLVRGLVYSLVLVLSFGTLFYSIKLWFVNRRKDIAIGIALGFPVGKFSRRLFSELFPLFCLGGVSAVFIAWLYAQVKGIWIPGVMRAAVLSLLLCMISVIILVPVFVRRIIKAGFLDMLSGE